MAGWAAIAAGTVGLGAALALVLRRGGFARAHGRARTRLSPAPPAPAGPPIEDLARSLRRLRPQVLAPVPGTPMARRRGTTAAYEDLLLQAAHALGVEDTLSAVPEGTDREAERLRLEDLLRQAGLALV